MTKWQPIIRSACHCQSISA